MTVLLPLLDEYETFETWRGQWPPGTRCRPVTEAELAAEFPEYLQPFVSHVFFMPGDPKTPLYSLYPKEGV